MKILKAPEPLNLIWENIARKENFYWRKRFAYLLIIISLVLYYKFMLNTKRFAYHKKMLYPEMSKQDCEAFYLN